MIRKKRNDKNPKKGNVISSNKILDKSNNVDYVMTNEQKRFYNYIKKNELFDEAFYLKSYQEVAQLKVDPLVHYILEGEKKGYFPNETFDPFWYTYRYEHVAESGLSPLEHYIKYGREVGAITKKQDYTEGRPWTKEEIQWYQIIDESGLFDDAFYLKNYPEVKDIGKEPLAHFIEYGSDHGYQPNEWFDPLWYREKHKEVKEHKINPFVHYLQEGKKKGYLFHPLQEENPASVAKKKLLTKDQIDRLRIILKIWALNIEFEKSRFIYSFLEKKDFLKSLNEINDIDVSYQKLHELLDLVWIYPLKFDKLDLNNSKIYLYLAKSKLIAHDIVGADKFLNLSLYFDGKNNKAIEFKGNIAKDVGNYVYAAEYYKNLVETSDFNEFTFSNLAECYENINKLDNSISMFERTELNTIYRKNIVERQLEKYLTEREISLLNDVLLSHDREDFLISSNELYQRAYRIFFKKFHLGEENTEKKLVSINRQRILIVGDYFVEQCVRYRIDQKVEQLKFFGFEVKTIDWTELDKNHNEIIFHDIVIFYRTPITIPLLKAVSVLNALNKVSIYEIDDLLFDPAYPDDIATYGGAVDLNQYAGLLQGMTKFNSMARLCRYGIASTLPLCRKLEPLIESKECILHRNGLDSKNYFMKLNKEAKKTIDIFYGSGTLAHNKDFIDLVLPVVDRLMREYDNIRLIIAGHLTLPKNFLDQHKKNIVILPKVEIEVYYSYLKEADINIAVLHPDTITDCKSELKWFEAACFYIPSVVSNTKNYLDVIREGVDGFIASTTEEWYEYLKKLINDKNLRERIGKNAAERVKKEYSIPFLGNQLKENISALVEKEGCEKKKKKIAIVNVFFPPQSIGGATRVVADNVDLMIEKYSDEYEICVFTSEADFTDPYKMSAYNYKGVRVYRASVLWQENMEWYYHDEKMAELFSEFLKCEEPDLVHFHCVQRLTASVVHVTREMQLPYFVTIHDAWWISDFQFLVDQYGNVYEEGHPDPYEERALPPKISREMSIRRLSYLKSLLGQAETVFVVSESFADIYRKNGIDNITVTPNGISSKVKWLPKDTSMTSKVVCAHIGGMSPHKGYNILRDAVKRSSGLEHVEFLVVDHSKEPSYIAHSKWGSVDVTFIGRQPQEKIVDLYRRIDVLFAPSIWPESFGLVTREAAACGCWVVASEMGGIGEDVEDGVNGFVIKPTVEALEETLKELDGNAHRYKNLAKSTKNIRFVERQVEEIIRQYEIVLGDEKNGK